MVERWFAELTTKQIRRGSHRSVPELERAIREFIDANNAEPKPFVWTKSADEILACEQAGVEVQVGHQAPDPECGDRLPAPGRLRPIVRVRRVHRPPGPGKVLRSTRTGHSRQPGEF